MVSFSDLNRKEEGIVFSLGCGGPLGRAGHTATTRNACEHSLHVHFTDLPKLSKSARWKYLLADVVGHSEHEAEMKSGRL